MDLKLLYILYICIHMSSTVATRTKTQIGLHSMAMVMGAFQDNDGNDWALIDRAMAHLFFNQQLWQLIGLQSTTATTRASIDGNGN